MPAFVPPLQLAAVMPVSAITSLDVNCRRCSLEAILFSNNKTRNVSNILGGQRESNSVRRFRY